MFPRSFFEAMATNEILQILVFSCFFGFAITTLKSEPAKTITSFISEMVPVMLKVTDFVMWFAPAGVFGAIAATITVQGLGVLATYGAFIGSFYIALLVLWAVLIGAGFLFLGPSVFHLIGLVKQPLVVAFSTASSEAAYPKLMGTFNAPFRLPPVPPPEIVFTLVSTVPSLTLSLGSLVM